MVEHWPAALETWVQTRSGEPKNFQYRLSSGETQQPVNHMRHKARGSLTQCSMLRQVKDPGYPWMNRVGTRLTQNYRRKVENLHAFFITSARDIWNRLRCKKEKRIYAQYMHSYATQEERSWAQRYQCQGNDTIPCVPSLWCFYEILWKTLPNICYQGLLVLLIPIDSAACRIWGVFSSFYGSQA